MNMAVPKDNWLDKKYVCKLKIKSHIHLVRYEHENSNSDFLFEFEYSLISLLSFDNHIDSFS